MQPEISEFSYGYCFVEECQRRYSFHSAPTFPTQVQEAELGYDVKIDAGGTPIFYQFKRSEHLTTRSALDWGTFSNPYYRFSLMKRSHSNQHQALIDLEANGFNVFYAAPRAHTCIELNNQYVQRSVVNMSFVIKPSDIGPITDDKSHTISFCATNSPIFVSRSKPVIKRVKPNPFQGSSIHRDQFKTVDFSVKEACDLLISLSSRDKKMEDVFPDKLRKISPFEVLQYIAITHLGLQLLYI
jgi:hypothetical protein